MILSVFLDIKKATHQLYEVLRRHVIVSYVSKVIDTFSPNSYMIQSLREGSFFFFLFSCFKYLVYAGDASRVADAVVCGANVNFRMPDVKDNRTPLITAAEFGFADIVELLLLSGATIDDADNVCTMTAILNLLHVCLNKKNREINLH